MKHVLRTFRVDTDFMIELVRTDPGVFLKYVNTKDQLADILTKGSFTAATWHVLCDLCCLGPKMDSGKGGKGSEEPKKGPKRTEQGGPRATSGSGSGGRSGAGSAAGSSSSRSSKESNL